MSKTSFADGDSFDFKEGDDTNLSLVNTAASHFTVKGLNETGDVVLLSNTVAEVPQTTKTDTDYTLTSNDSVVSVSTGSTDRTMTLPLASTARKVVLTVHKKDSGTGNIIVKGNGAETINGNNEFTMYNQYDSIRILCDGSAWFII